MAVILSQVTQEQYDAAVAEFLASGNTQALSFSDQSKTNYSVTDMIAKLRWMAEQLAASQTTGTPTNYRFAATNKGV